MSLSSSSFLLALNQLWDAAANESHRWGDRKGLGHVEGRGLTRRLTTSLCLFSPGLHGRGPDTRDRRREGGAKDWKSPDSDAPCAVSPAPGEARDRGRRRRRAQRPLGRRGGATSLTTLTFSYASLLAHDLSQTEASQRGARTSAAYPSSPLRARRGAGRSGCSRGRYPAIASSRRQSFPSIHGGQHSPSSSLLCSGRRGLTTGGFSGRDGV